MSGVVAVISGVTNNLIDTCTGVMGLDLLEYLDLGLLPQSWAIWASEVKTLSTRLEL